MAFAPLFFGSGVTITATTVSGRQIVSITRGDSVTLAFAVATDYTGWTVVFTVRHRTTDAVLVSVSGTVASTTLINVPLTATDTAFASLTTCEDFGPHPLDIQLTQGDSRQTIKGIAIINRDETRT